LGEHIASLECAGHHNPKGENKLAWQQAKGRWTSTVLQTDASGWGARCISLAFNPDGSGEFFVAYTYDESGDGWFDSLFVVRGQKAGDTVTITKPHYRVRGGTIGYGVFCSLDYINGQPAIVHSVMGYGDKVLYEYRVSEGVWGRHEVAFGHYATLTTHGGNAYISPTESN